MISDAASNATPDSSPAAACYYERLGLAPDDDPAAVERRWQYALSTHHHDSGGTADDLARLRTAYETLSDDADRRAYDDLRGEFGGARAAALFEEWVAGGRTGDPVSYYRNGRGDVDAAVDRQRDREPTPAGGATDGSDGDGTDEGRATPDPAAWARGWFDVENGVGVAPGVGFLSWLACVAAAVAFGRIGEVPSPGPSTGVGPAWVGVAVCVAFGGRYAVRLAAGDRSATVRWPGLDVARIGASGVVGLLVVAAAAADPALPYMGFRFVVLVASALVVAGTVFGVGGALLGTAAGGFTVGSLVAFAAMLTVSPFDSDSFQATMFRDGVHPYPFVSPHRVGVFNLGFLANLAVLILGVGALSYACVRAARLVLSNGTAAYGREPSTWTVWTVVPAFPTALAVHGALSGAAPPAAVRGALARVAPEVTGLEATALLATAVLIAWGVNLRVFVRRPGA